jgi:hypothetical protein
MKERGGSIFYWLPFSFWLLVPFFCTREISLLLSYLSSLLFFLLFSFTYTHTHRGRKTKDLRERLTVWERAGEILRCSSASLFLYCISAANRNGPAINYRETETEMESAGSAFLREFSEFCFLFYRCCPWAILKER